MSIDKEDKIVLWSTFISTAVGMIVGSAVMAWEVWNYGFEPDFTAHSQTTADNLGAFALGGALLLGVPSFIISFVAALIVTRIVWHQFLKNS